MAAQIPPDLAAKLLEKDIFNLVQRVKSGQRLTRGERSMLQALSTAGHKSAATGKADNYVELADALGVSRRALQKWRKIPGSPEPEANGQHSIDAWRNFCTLHNLKGRDGVPQDMDEMALRARKLLAETEDKELKVAIQKREWVRMDEVAEKWATGVALATSLFRKKFENELPPILSGLDAPAIQVECRAAIDEVLTVLHTGAVEEGRLFGGASEADAPDDGEIDPEDNEDSGAQE